MGQQNFVIVMIAAYEMSCKALIIKAYKNMLPSLFANTFITEYKLTLLTLTMMLLKGRFLTD
jgi:hypothetical protein